MGNSSEFYDMLNVSKYSSAEEIRKAYKSLARKWHPDKHPISSKLEAEARFKAISQAYKALRDQENRRILTSHGSIKRAYYSVSDAVTRKPPPIERKLECTLEELFWGCKKQVWLTTDVITKAGFVVQKTECHTIRVMPGWKEGTRIIFESKRNDKSDHVFVITEECHSTFKRSGDDLVVKVDVPLANALASSSSFSLRLLNGEKMNYSFYDEIIFPGSEKIIEGQGMPVAARIGARGDLRIKFDVVFPEQWSEKQRMDIVEIIRNKSCSVQ